MPRFTLTHLMLQLLSNDPNCKCHPNSAYRTVRLHEDLLPAQYQGLSRDELLKAVRWACELLTSGQDFKRCLVKGHKGYHYQITDKGLYKLAELRENMKELQKVAA